MQQQVNIKFVKTHKDARLPKFNIEDPLIGDIGADVYSTGYVTVPAHGSIICPVGLTVGYITPGYYFIIAPRSGLGFKHGIMPHAGRIDNQYRGDIGIKLFNLSDEDYVVNIGDRIAQLEFHKLIQPEFSFTDEVTDSARGEKGFGSSGN